MKRHTPLWISLASVCGVLGIVGSVAWALSPLYGTQLNGALNVKTFNVINKKNDDTNEDTEYYKSAYEKDDDLIEDAGEHPCLC